MAKISKETNIPLSTLCDNLKKLESGVIQKHASLLDFSKLGFNFKATFVISTNKKKELRDFLTLHPQVNSLSTLINNYDFYAECVFRDLKDMESFKDKLDCFEIKELEENLIIEEFKKEGFFI